MEKWVYLFEIEEHQVIAKKGYDAKQEEYQIEFLSLKNGVELSVKLSFQEKQQRNLAFEEEEGIKNYAETAFKKLLFKL